MQAVKEVLLSIEDIYNQHPEFEKDILPFFGRLPEIWQRDVNGPGREWPDASVRSWDSRQNRPLQARRPEAIHTISLADSSQLLIEREERSSIAPRNNEIEHVVDRVVILNGRMDRF